LSCPNELRSGYLSHALRILLTCSAVNTLTRSDGLPVCGGLMAVAGFFATQPALWQSQKHERTGSRFFWAVTGESGQPARNARTLVTSNCLSSRLPMSSREGSSRLSSRFSCLASVAVERFWALL
jgi:hypothetical protein